MGRLVSPGMGSKFLQAKPPLLSGYQAPHLQGGVPTGLHTLSFFHPLQGFGCQRNCKPAHFSHITAGIGFIVARRGENGQQQKREPGPRCPWCDSNCLLTVRGTSVSQGPLRHKNKWPRYHECLSQRFQHHLHFAYPKHCPSQHWFRCFASVSISSVFHPGH